MPLPSPTPETPGIPLGGYTTGFTGTVVAFQQTSFVDNVRPIPFARGIFNSFVVDRGGGLLDFYYQLVNTSDPDPFGFADFFRFDIVAGYNQLQNPFLLSGILVAQTNSLAGLNTFAFPAIAGLTQGAGLQAAATADRDVGTFGNVGFSFPTQPPIPSIGNPNNVNVDETSAFLVVRTISPTYAVAQSRVSGFGTATIGTFAPTPEPTSSLLCLAGLCVTLGSRIRASRLK